MKAKKNLYGTDGSQAKLCGHGQCFFMEWRSDLFYAYLLRNNFLP